MKPNVTAGADLQLRSSKSQVVLVLVVLIAAACYLGGIAFLWHEKPHAWVPLLLGSFLFIFVFGAWFKAQRDTDLENSQPTSISDAHGNEISTDIRALKSPEFIQILNQVFCTGANREPLPEPDGMVDEQGVPIRDSATKACERVDAVNYEAQDLAATIEKVVGKNEKEKISLASVEAQPFSQALLDRNEKI